MIVLVSLIVLLRELLVNDFYMFTLVSHIFIASRRNAITRMRTLAPRLA